MLHTALPSKSSAMSDNMIRFGHSMIHARLIAFLRKCEWAVMEVRLVGKGEGKGHFHSQFQLPFIPISAVLLCNSKSLSVEMVYIQTCIEKIPGSDWWLGKFMLQPETEDRRRLLRNNYTTRGFRCPRGYDPATSPGGVPDGVTEPARGMSQRYPSWDVSGYVPLLSSYFAVVPIPIPFLAFDPNLPDPIYYRKYTPCTLIFS